MRDTTAKSDVSCCALLSAFSSLSLDTPCSTVIVLLFLIVHSGLLVTASPRLSLNL